MTITLGGDPCLTSFPLFSLSLFFSPVPLLLFLSHTYSFLTHFSLFFLSALISLCVSHNHLYPHSFFLSHPAQPLTLSIQEGSQTVDLSFESSEANAPLVVRAIQVAPGFTYKFQCARVGGLDGNSQIWYRGDVLVSLNTSERIYARMPNSNSWILEVTSFSSGDGGMYSCRSSEEMLGLDISSGKWSCWWWLPGAIVMVSELLVVVARAIIGNVLVGAFGRGWSRLPELLVTVARTIGHGYQFPLVAMQVT